MNFYMGLIVGFSSGLICTSFFYMFVIRFALSDKRMSNSGFQQIQKENGSQIKRIADAIEKFIDK